MQRDVTVRGVLGACLATLVLSAIVPLVTIAVVNSSVSDQADKTERIALNNCSTLNENTGKLVQLVDILGAIVSGGALGPDAKINVEEPRLLQCKGENAGKLEPKLSKKEANKRTYKAPADAPPLPNPQK
jgi:hypothetical protein